MNNLTDHDAVYTFQKTVACIVRRLKEKEKRRQRETTHRPEKPGGPPAA
jgi:hypothetical protein